MKHYFLEMYLSHKIYTHTYREGERGGGREEEREILHSSVVKYVNEFRNCSILNLGDMQSIFALSKLLLVLY